MKKQGAKKSLTFVEVLIVFVIIAIMVALLIPNFITVNQMRRRKEKMAELVSLANGTVDFIEATNISSDEKKPYIEFLKNKATFSENLPVPKTLSEAREQINSLSKELELLQQPKKWIPMVNSKETITSDPIFNIYLDISNISARVDTLYSERITRWDVVLVCIMVISGLSALTGLIIFVTRIPKLFHKIHKKRRIQSNPKARKIKK